MVKSIKLTKDSPMTTFVYSLNLTTNFKSFETHESFPFEKTQS
jgi:hypothetical protein